MVNFDGDAINRNVVFMLVAVVRGYHAQDGRFFGFGSFRQVEDAQYCVAVPSPRVEDVRT